MISRRALLASAAALLVAPLARAGRVWQPVPESRRSAGAGKAASKAPTPALEGALDASDYVYVSPLRTDGAESTCHGEVWYGWLDGAVVIITSKGSWKARSLAGGRDQARIWVGNHGRVKRIIGTNDAFRKAPHFDARAAQSKDAALLDRLLATFEKKYPEEIAAWRDKMRSGFSDGSRVLIRYTPA